MKVENGWGGNINRLRGKYYKNGMEIAKADNENRTRKNEKEMKITKG